MHHKYICCQVFLVITLSLIKMYMYSHDTRRSKDLYVTAINKNFGKRCIELSGMNCPKFQRIIYLSETLLED